MVENIIEVKNLIKKFKNFVAVNNVSFNVQKGEILGFLGPNGAGKTTTINILTTLMKANSGNAMIAGFDLTKDAENVRNAIGVVPQSFSLFPELTAIENLEYIGKLYGLNDEEIKKQAESALKKVDLYEHKNKISGTFSGGMKQKLSIASSIMSNPQVLFMDEITQGLDPQSRIRIRELTKELNKKHGITIIYVTHDMPETELVCNRIIIMDKGQIMASGTSDELKRKIIHNKNASLEDVFIKLTKKDLRDK